MNSVFAEDHQTAEADEGRVYLKSADELAAMRRAGRLLRRVIREVLSAVDEGITTLELDKLAYRRIREAGAIPGFLGLYDFPNTLCISVNEEVVHGIPSKRRLKQGDIISVDCGLVLDGFYSDHAWTVGVGKLDPEVERLLAVTEKSLQLGIDAARVGNRVGDIGAAIEEHVVAAGFSVVEEYTGHGIGRRCHEEPKVYNTGARRGRRIASGLTLAIEPMVNIGTGKTRELGDGWTVVTADRSLSAHFEHTVAITSEGPEILTRDEDD